jgi:hypothetical protein
LVIQKSIFFESEMIRVEYPDFELWYQE